GMGIRWKITGNYIHLAIRVMASQRWNGGLLQKQKKFLLHHQLTSQPRTR
ncbi:hypothetical protein KI387_006061, partial [Taxus chinensis]